jgi:hypothetical protein
MSERSNSQDNINGNFHAVGGIGTLGLENGKAKVLLREERRLEERAVAACRRRLRKHKNTEADANRRVELGHGIKAHEAIHDSVSNVIVKWVGEAYLMI